MFTAFPFKEAKKNYCTKSLCGVEICETIVVLELTLANLQFLAEVVMVEVIATL
jgi:hypothetical protein